MKNAAPADRGLLARHADWLPPLLILLLLASSWVFLIRRSNDDDSRAIRDAMIIQGNIAQMVVNYTEHLFESLRLSSQILSRARSDEEKMDVLRAVLERNGAFLRLMQFDASGQLLLSIGKTPESWLKAAAWEFARISRSDVLERIVIGEAPRLDHAQAWMLPVFYRPAAVNLSASTFIVVLIDKGQFQQLFGDIMLGKGGEIVLLADDERELLRLREGRLESVPTLRKLQLPDPGNEQVYWMSDPLVAFKRAPQSPLSVLVSRSRSEVLEDNHAMQRSYKGSVLLLTATMLGLTFLWIVAARRRQKLILSLTVAQRNNEHLIAQIGKEKEAAYVLATHDKLTGLPNRMLFADLARRYVGRAQRLRGGFALMFIDLDRFKPVNDTYGHKAGDQLLIEVARRLQNCVRQTDVVSRFGGDEFVALVCDLRNNQDVSVVAEKFIEVLSSPYEGIVEDVALHVTPSIGVAFYPDDADEIDALLRQADMAMYHAKEKGRATYAFADPALNRRVEISNQIEAALPAAIVNGEIRVHYQPKVLLSDFSISGLEALSRWEHPSLGKVSPADFIPVAEKSGVIIALGEYVVTEVCRQLQEWSRAGLPVVPVAVNVSTRQLRTPDFVDCVAEILGEFGISPDLLHIEITETGLIGSDDGIPTTLNRLSALGIQLAIDDFGTGYSGLSHLRNLPVKYLKIDRLFIKDIRNDISDAAIVSTTISLSHNLNLETIAEGVETQEQVAHLRAARCDQAQGFLFSPPCDATTVEKLLRQRKIVINMDGRT